MATKTFKIGLSNTDKQNMAQDVYERLLALTFPEYDTETTYSVGDFVVYNDQLYKCIGSTSGAWDSTKWQLATLNDLVTDIEDAVQFVNDKANVDGNYPTLTAGLADNLTPYSEDSGVEQDNPFISNGIGTNNNTEIVTVGDYGLLKEKQGHTLAVNQLFLNPTFINSSNWSANEGSLNVTDNKATFTVATPSTGNAIRQSMLDGIKPSHKYLIKMTITSPKASSWGLYVGNTSYQGSTLEPNNKTDIVAIVTASSNVTDNTIYLYCNRNEALVVGDEVIYENCYCIDLTQMFNGDIPQDLLDNPSHFSWYYNGSLAYNAGSLVNANGVKLVSTGRNICDEIFEGGSINSSGQNVVAYDTFRTKNYIQVNPNGIYHLHVSSALGVQAYIWHEYDKDKNFIKVSYKYSNNSTLTIQQNTRYLRLSFYKSGSTLGSNVPTKAEAQVTLTPYYTPEEGGEGYDKYYPYEEPYIVETGNEVLRQAGSVKDYKEPDGTKHNIVGNAVYDGSSDENWTLQSINTHGIANFSIGLLHKRDTSNSICNILLKQTSSIVDETSRGYRLSGGNTLFIRIESSVASTVDAFKTWLASNNISINYELATPTTEEGTPFAENLPINDYGMLYWLDSSNNLVGIPQGCKIFYPVNYKGFIDDVYARTDGDAGKLVIQEERTADKTELQGVDTQLQNAIGGTLRHLLASANSLDFLNTDVVDLGTLNWFTENSSNRVYGASISNKANGRANLLVSNYCYDGTTSGYANLTDKCFRGANDNSNIYIRDTNYSSSEDFKNAMKGVLLAYEKESA